MWSLYKKDENSYVCEKYFYRGGNSSPTLKMSGFPCLKTTLNILVLEDRDVRQRPFRQNNIGHNLVIVDDSKVCIDRLKSQTWDLLCLDHDLGGEEAQENQPSGEGTGWEVARFLAQNPQYKPDQVILHSSNGPGPSP